MVLKTIRTVADRWQHGKGEYGHIFEPYVGDECIALDLETTSLDPESADILSIGAVKVRGKKVVTSERLDIKLQKPETLTAESIKIHKIRGIDLHGGEALGDALVELLNFIGNRPIMGYYIDFDIAVLNRHIRPRYGFSLPNKVIELSHLYQQKVQRANPELQPDLHFEKIAEKLSVPIMGRHTAVGDAITTALMYVRTMQGNIPL
ncbi:DNA polymerase-3 subunit epsilon [Oceanospirillum multiglobuliferum]|uniref:DNA polymerase III subunit epsilon n=1 Tax=Oceanospirillum multiglobuliferum TaxID=64969 RepID=A0A1T4L9S0_9GAMM|nr:3'-5' exonuclease [Oceanospirillum multiglobuliferum]OPX56745.1 DNA polymerase III subunit epsilon [Oceanospirillum multiglobuliferum]SJZ51321.1 DNA polymerase-3 subunit epsilon [Oceanospirillum multiglobuliferum]